MSHKQDQEKEEKDSYPNEDQDFKGDDQEEEGEGNQTDGDKKEQEAEAPKEIIEEKHHDKSEDEVTIDVKTVSQNPPDSQERVVPQEFEVRLKHQKSIEDQVIETRQDQDLLQEREDAKLHKEEDLKKEQEAAPEQEGVHKEETAETADAKKQE